MAWDYFHINSVTKGDDGHYLLSARHSSTIYKINGTDGTVIWRLGGNHSDFVLGTDVPFGFQHHARYMAQKLEEVVTRRSIYTLFHGANISGLTTNQRRQPWSAYSIPRIIPFYHFRKGHYKHFPTPMCWSAGALKVKSLSICPAASQFSMPSLMAAFYRIRSRTTALFDTIGRASLPRR